MSHDDRLTLLITAFNEQVQQRPELAHALQKTLLTALSRRCEPFIGRRRDRQSARLQRDIRLQTQQFLALCAKRRSLLMMLAALVDALPQRERA